MEFKDWINQKYFEYLQQYGVRSTITEFAAHIGTTQTTLSSWMNGTRIPGRQKSIDLLVSKFGPEVYEIIGKDKPVFGYEPMSEAPPEVRKRLTAALSEANQQYRLSAERGKQLSDAEAERILHASLYKYGFFSREIDPT